MQDALLTRDLRARVMHGGHKKAGFAVARRQSM
jgi:hypothetical protein